MRAKICLVLGAITYASGASINQVLVDQSVPESVTGPSDSFTWKYDSQTVTNSYDPNDWDMADATYVCNSGSSQSPINIVPGDVQSEATDPGAIIGTLFGNDIEGYLANTGRVLRYMLFGYARPTITGGVLGTKTYALSHIDFHFGSVSTQGSEHTVNGNQYAMEMEMVFYDGTFMSSQDAMASTEPDALAAVSHFFSVDTSDNAALKPIIDEITNIEHNFVRRKRSARKNKPQKARQSSGTVAATNIYTGNNNLVSDVFINLETLLGSTSVDNYYYYDGSMTMPGCTENTKWIINPTPLTISEAQLTTLRTLKTNDVNVDYLQDNFRPVQSLGSRTVYKRTAPFSVDQTSATILGSTLFSLLTFHGVTELLKEPQIAKAIRKNPITDFIAELAEQGQQVVQQRSSDGEEADQYQHVYHQPVYQPQQYQQYVPQSLPVAPAPAQ